ncbi:uncharacterized membrane protein YozB (DUF420 family) [Salibacterium salarium]|uniref:DUF3267 domain-containing protein n=1 Tax=Salibacterium salarium TaxID=284579 RepID=UPI00278AFECB|nr:DUF3267 domain-containing protein [Salibacterium salarium]MDQ0299871.1 uncharacterized membrane protein YozB (DUF420 family) [Salibacterium salarium]
MNCWKSINLKKEYNPSRLMLLSMSVMITTFVISYLVFSLYYENISYAELGLIDTLLFLLLLFPIHTILHLIPLRFVGVRMQWNLKMSKKKRAPLLLLRFTKPVGRNFYINAMLFPTLFISVVSIVSALTFPSFMLYFVLLFSFNAGLAVYDFIYIKQLLGAPRHCFIEQNKNGMDILLKQPI